MSLIAHLKSRLRPQTLAVMLVTVTLTASTAAPDPTQTLAGRYYRQFQDAFVDGEKYIGKDVVEIVPVAPGATYFRVDLDFFNGHSCGIFGIAHPEGDALVYHDPGYKFAGQTCVLKIKRAGKSLLIDDGGGSCAGHCGARGSLWNQTIPYATRGPIRYMRRLKASEQYRRAIKEWRTGIPIWEQLKTEQPPPPPKDPNCPETGCPMR